MRNFQFLFLATFLFLFASCETESMEPLVQQSLHEVDLIAHQDHAKAPQNFKAHLNGDEEVHEVVTNATGQINFKLSKDGTQLSYKLNVANIENVFASHIHAGEFGQNGGVVVTLYGGGLISGRTNGTLAEGVITADDLGGSLEGESLDALLELMHSGGTYVNVHTQQYGAGELRGQISASN